MLKDRYSHIGNQSSQIFSKRKNISHNNLRNNFKTIISKSRLYGTPLGNYFQCDINNFF